MKEIRKKSFKDTDVSVNTDITDKSVKVRIVGRVIEFLTDLSKLHSR